MGLPFLHGKCFRFRFQNVAHPCSFSQTEIEEKKYGAFKKLSTNSHPSNRATNGDDVIEISLPDMNASYDVDAR